MTCRELTVERVYTPGFILSADKYADLKPFTATLNIAYPSAAGQAVSIVVAGTAGSDTCVQDVTLNAAGTASVSYNVGQTQMIYALVKKQTCCTTFDYMNCPNSNFILLNVGPTGSINFVSLPAGAEVFLDGTDQGVSTPNTITGVPAGAHTYTLKLANFNDYTGTVTVIKDHVVQVSAALVPAEGCIFFNTIPQGAKIYLDDIEVTGIVTPGLKCSLALGAHTYRLVLAGYTPAIGSVTLAAGQGASVSETLTRETGSVSFNSTPAGAEIIIDGTDQNTTTPSIITEITGTHSYTLRKTGYNDYSGDITISVGETASVEAVLVPAEGCIFFNTTPAGARVFIDNADTGQVTPVLVCGLALGAHTYRLVLSGYKDRTGNVNLSAGQGTAITGSLEKKGTGAGTYIVLALVGAGTLGAVVYATRKKTPPYAKEYLKYPG